MDAKEIRLRCIEAAARQPFPHKDGPVAAVQHAASIWFDWINGDSPAPVSIEVRREPADKKDVPRPSSKDVLY